MEGQAMTPGDNWLVDGEIVDGENARLRGKRMRDWGHDEDDRLFPLPHEQMPAGIERWRVVCTDRGQHPERLLGYLFDRRASEHGDIYARPRPRPSQQDGDRQSHRRKRALSLSHEAGLSDKAPTQRFVCNTCRRDTPLRPDTLERVVDALLSADATRRTLDVSSLA